MTATPKCITSLACILLLTGCGDINVKKYIPFTGDAPVERSRTPVNAVEYQCATGKRLYLRTLDGGAAVWLILAEREVRLEKLGDASRYGKGNTVLDLNGDAATVTEGATTTYAGCKTGGEAAAPAAK